MLDVKSDFILNLTESKDPFLSLLKKKKKTKKKLSIANLKGFKLLKHSFSEGKEVSIQYTIHANITVRFYFMRFDKVSCYMILYNVAVLQNYITQHLNRND